MALSNYDELKAEVAALVSRSDLTSSSTAMDSFLAQAEAYINRNLRIIRGTKDTTLTSTAGQPTIDLPDDFLDIRSLEFDSTPHKITYLPDAAFQNKSIVSSISKPTFYTLVFDDQNDRWQLRLGSVPAGEYSMSLKYYYKVPALSSSNVTNWLLNYHPQVYLDGALYFAFKRYRNKDMINFYGAEFKGAIDTLNSENRRTMFGGTAPRTQPDGAIV